MIQKISETPNVKKVIDDVQTATSEIQAQLQKINTDDAVKKYKELVKKVSTKEKQLQKEVTMVVAKFKKTAAEVEKNLESYKKKAQVQRTKIEKTIQAKAAQLSKPKKATVKKSTVKKATAKKKVAVKKAARKA